MKVKFLKEPEREIPVFIGSLIILNGLIHVVISACLFIKVPIPYFFKFNDIVNLSVYKGASGLFGIFLGFLLIIIGKGVTERKRRSWWFAVIILSLLTINTLYINALPKTHFPNIILLVCLILSVRYFRNRDQISIGYQQMIAWLSIIIAVTYGVCGSYLLRNEFANIKSWSDALYFTIVTYSTVGFGDLHPLTEHAKFFTVSMILVGIGSFATLFTFLIEPIIYNRMKGVLSIMKKIAHISDHVIICGYTRLTIALIKQLEEKNVSFIILENSVDKKTEIEEKYMTIAGNTFQKETFYNAKIDSANSVITAFDNDSDNILTLMTVSEILEETQNKKTKLISRIDNEENIEKAKKLGASEVVSPTKMAASFIMGSSFEG